MASLRYIRDGYIVLGFLFVWLLSIYVSISWSTGWHLAWINDNFGTMVFLVVIDGLFLFWQAVDQRKNKLYIGGSVILAIFAVLVTTSRIALTNAVTAWTGVYGISVACLVMGIIVYGSASMAVQQKQ